MIHTLTDLTGSAMALVVTRGGFDRPGTLPEGTQWAWHPVERLHARFSTKGGDTLYLHLFWIGTGTPLEAVAVYYPEDMTPQLILNLLHTLRAERTEIPGGFVEKMHRGVTR